MAVASYFFYDRKRSKNRPSLTSLLMLICMGQLLTILQQLGFPPKRREPPNCTQIEQHQSLHTFHKYSHPSSRANAFDDKGCDGPDYPQKCPSQKSPRARARLRVRACVRVR
eukprot:3352930-Amphidinium_carterae.1